MQTIKYRVWDKKEKRFLPLTTLPVKGENMPIKNVYVGQDGSIIQVEEDLVNDTAKVRVIRQEDVEIVMCTGLTDKNGKEIYEGYILRVDEYRRTQDDYKGHAGVVEYCAECCAGYRLQMIGIGNNESLWNLSVVEVIGNIYENPELLNQ